MGFNNSSDVFETTSLDYEQMEEDEGVSLSLQGLNVFEIVNHVILSGTVCIVGIVVNVINMIVFVKQGLNNTVNISMFAIAVSDFCSLITLEWLNINLNPFMENADIPYEPSEIQYLTGGWPHACFLQITIWITVYVTAERFICIAVPLKVKLIFTPFRTKIVVVVIYVLMFIALSPEYVTLYFGDNFYESRNQTRVGLKERKSREQLKDLVFVLFSIMGIISFGILILFTLLLVITLSRRSEWRKKSTADEGKSDAMTKRDQKTMKMVGLIAGVLIVCAAPGMFLSIVVIVVPGFDIVGKYANILHASWSFAFLAEAINSTVNIFFFFKMSSKFRRECYAIFNKCKLCRHKDGDTGKRGSSNVRATSSVSSGLKDSDTQSANTVSTTDSRSPLAT